MGQELNRLAPSSCCRHRRPMGVRGRRAPTAQPSRVGKALPLFFGGTVARRLADRNPLTTTWSSSPDERLMVKLPISTCPLSTSLGRFDWRWRLLLTSGIIWLPEYFREAAPSRRLTKIQISLLQLRLPSDPRTSSKEGEGESDAASAGGERARRGLCGVLFTPLWATFVPP